MKKEKQVKISGIPVYCRFDKAVDLEKITPHPRNPNKHPDEQLALLAKIIRAQGWRNPIVVSNRSGFIVKGHGRLKAAGILNVAQAPVEYQDYATEAEEYADMIADNRIAELAERDMAMIKDLLLELDTGATDMDLTGYTNAAMEDLMTQFHVPGDADAEPQIDKADELNKTWKVKPGDLYTIGDHRLLCGDSTKAEDVARVMDGDMATCVFTDPPYGVSYSGRGKSTSLQTIDNDDLNTTELQVFLLAVFRVMPCAPGCNVFICHADQKPGIRPAFESAFLNAGFRMGGTMVWVKNVAPMGWQDFRAAHEPILFGWTDGEGRVRVEDRSMTTVWSVGREGGYLHPTTKPVELVSIAIRACSIVGAIVWDSFLGSGTTMLAAQNLNRKCYGIEISPAYCAVILQRMKDAFPDIKITKSNV